MGRDSLLRHAGAHIPESLVKATDAAEVVQADGLLDRVRALEARVVRALDLAEHGKDYRGVFAGARELREVLRLLAELAGKLAPAGTSVQVVHVLVEYTPDQLEHLADLAREEAADMRRGSVVTTTGNSALPDSTERGFPVEATRALEPSFPGAAATETTETGPGRDV